MNICDPDERARTMLQPHQIKYVWVRNVDSSEEIVEIVTDVNQIYPLMAPSDKLYRLGQEVKLKLTLEVVSEPVHRTSEPGILGARGGNIY